MRLEQYFADKDLSIKEAIERLNKESTQILLVVDSENRLLGTVTDGDIRRAILRADASVSGLRLKDVMRPSPIIASTDWSPQRAKSVMLAKRIHHIPIVDQHGFVSGIFTEESLLTREYLPNTAMLMVGGLGTRLGDMTKDCPKPMLRIGGKPILETIVESLRDAGIKHIVLAVNYLADQIRDYFLDGSAHNVRIEYVTEQERLGTAGALRLLTPVPESPFLVMNGDILTRVNFQHLLRYHSENDAVATMCIREFDQQVPFGVVDLNGIEISQLREKPTNSFFVNSGIYVLDPIALHYVPSTGAFDMPSLFDLLREQNKRTVGYPIQEYWTDIGLPADFQAAATQFEQNFASVTGPQQIAAEFPSQSQPQRFVIVGLGSIGRRHLANLRKLRPNAQIAVCRLSGKSDVNEIPEHCDVVLHSLEEVVKFKPVAAIIAGPASTHVAVATILAKHGVDLLIEKPVSTNEESVGELIAVTEATGVVAMVGYSLRFLPGLQAARQAILSGKIGQVLSVRAAVGQYLPDWRPGTDYRESVSARAELGGGALLELSHEFDYLAWMFGFPDRIIACGGKFGPLEMNAENFVEILLHYDSPQRMISLHLDFLDRAGFRELRVIGETGTLCWNALDDSVALYEAGTRQWRKLETVALTERNQMYVNELNHFLDCVETGDAPLIDVSHAAKVMGVVDAARESMINGTSVEVARVVC